MVLIISIFFKLMSKQNKNAKVLYFMEFDFLTDIKTKISVRDEILNSFSFFKFFIHLIHKNRTKIFFLNSFHKFNMNFIEKKILLFSINEFHSVQFQILKLKISDWNVNWLLNKFFLSNFRNVWYFELMIWVNF